MNLDQNKFAAIVEAAKQKSANSPAWQRCLDKASKMLASGELVATVRADGVLVTSPNGSYLVTAGHCPCVARTKHCYHRCAARIATLMEETAAGAVSHADDRAQVIADIKSRWPIACPGVHLADELMARFKRNSLDMLSIDFLTAIRAAIA